MNEMSEQPRPIRAWGEYDDGRLWLDMHDVQEMDAPAVFVPSTAEGLLVYIEAVQDHTDDWSLPGFIRWWGAQEGSGPLRSLRVLLSTGHEVTMDCCVEDGYCIDGTFTWELRDGQQWPCGGSITDLSDADAVARAISEAVAWVSEHEGVKA